MAIKFRLAIILFSFLFSAISLQAQDAPLTLSYNVNSNRSVDFSFTKEDPGTYTVVLKFSTLTNCTASLTETRSVKGMAGSLLALRPQNENQAITFNYSYGYIRGKLNPKFDPYFVYILPYKKETKVRVAEAPFLAARYFGNTTPEDWKCYNFYTSEEDTVVAARKGLVVQVKDEFDVTNPKNTAYTSSMNELTIEHEDGTLARYRGFKKGISVKVGETVYPGTVLGKNSKFSGDSRSYNIAFYVYYLKSDDIETNRQSNLSNSKTLYGFVTPHFYTESYSDAVLEDKKNYTASISDEIVKKELSKKELKKLENHK